MRVYCDLQAIQTPHNADRGIARYVTEFSRAVQRDHADAVDAWVLNPDLPTPPQVLELLAGGRVRHADDRELPVPDVWHVLSPFEEAGAGRSVDLVWPQWARSSRTRLYVTLYDLIPLLYPERYLDEPFMRRAYMNRVRLVEHADRVLAISEATARDAVRLLGIPPARVDVVGTGVSEHFVPPADGDAVLDRLARELPRLRPGYVLYTGGIDFRKNIEGLLTAYAGLPESLRARHQLVIVCGIQPADRDRLERLGRDLGVADDVLFTGYVPDDVLLRTYQAAHLFVFPSLYEGFGLPVVEALSCGVPALVGSNSSLVELVEDPEAWFDATSPEDITRAMRAALTDDAFRARLRRRGTEHGHHWNIVAERTVAAYAHASATAVDRTGTPRIALVSPMPPAQSGVADYSMQLLLELVAGATVDVFTAPDAARPELPGVRWYTYAEMPAVLAMSGDYDLKVVAMGNSTHHFECFRLLARYGGTVIAHDVRYTDFFSAAAALQPDLVDDDTRSTLLRMHAGALPDRFSGYRQLSGRQYYRVNDLLVDKIATPADGVLVHSATAATLARLDLPPELRAKVEVIPFGHTLGAGAAAAADTVASFGIVSDLKRSDVVVRAFIDLAAQLPSLQFALVGECFDRKLWESLHRTVVEAGVAHRITLTGRVGEREYRDWLSRTRLAVQLRSDSNGETSAAVADCLGAGIPTLVSRVGSMAELGNVCAQLPPSATATELAATVSALLADRPALAELGRRGRGYAEEHSFRAVAESLLKRARGAGQPREVRPALAG